MSVPPSDPIDVDTPGPSAPHIKSQDTHTIPLEAQDNDMHDSSLPARNGRPRYKSWRKKYRKMRLKFDNMMDETNGLFIAEHKAWNTARRIQEEIDQILEILLEVNADTKTPAQLRWDLRLPDDPDPLQLIQQDPAMSSTAASSRSLAKLYTRIAHTNPSTFSTTPPSSTDLLPPDLLDLDPQDTFTTTTPPSLLSAEHESAYLVALDASLATSAHSLSHSQGAGNLPPGIEAVAPPSTAPTRPRPLPTEKDFATKCPVSVHSWLKRNQPQVFESTALDGKGPRRQTQGNHGIDDSEIEAPGSSHGGKVRKSLGAKAAAGAATANVKIEEMELRNMLNAEDEETGVDASDTASVGGRRKGRAGVEEESYRPKGGRNGKRKRTQEEAGSGSGDVKRARKSTA